MRRAPNLEVSLITYGPGETYWERFGHDAIELRDIARGEAINFNYGVFDFDEKDFFLNFARGRMHYLMDAEPSRARRERSMSQAGRSVTRQRLALDAGQAAGACATSCCGTCARKTPATTTTTTPTTAPPACAMRWTRRWAACLQPQLRAAPGRHDLPPADRAPDERQPWLMLVLDLGLGPYADQPLTAWQESFLPDGAADAAARSPGR